jgi:hypothetical protein
MGLTPGKHSPVSYNNIDQGPVVHIDLARRTLATARKQVDSDETLRLLSKAHLSLVAATAACVVEGIVEQGLTWQEIGEALGVSRQSAWEGFNTFVRQEGRLGGPKRR